MLTKPTRKILSMKEKDKPKCKEWERRRREKLNDAFKILSQLLPNYDPAKNLPKIDILERSTEFVKELRLSNSRLVSHQSETDEKCKLIKELQDEVNKLILRVKQLTTLLKAANIPIPIGPCMITLGPRKLKWTDKITLDGRSWENSENTEVCNNGDTPIPTPCSNKDSSKDSVEKPAHQTPAVGNSPLKETNSGHIVAAVSTTSPNPVPTHFIIYNNPNANSPTNSVNDASNVQEEIQCISSSPIQSNNTPSASSSVSPQKQKLLAKKAKNPTNVPNLQPQLSTTSVTPTTSTTTAIPLTTSAPVTAVLTEPPKSTTATMLPMQTFILTSCPINSTVMNSSPITRIALGQTRILSQGSDGAYTFSNVLQKIPILPIRKPISKIKRKRRRRNKNNVLEDVPVISVPVPEAECNVNKSSADDKVVAESEVEAVTESSPAKDTSVTMSDPTENNQVKSGTPPVENQIIQAEKTTPESNNEEEITPTPVLKLALQNDKENMKSKPTELMQIQLYAHEPDQEESMEVDTTTKVSSHEPDSPSNNTNDRNADAQKSNVVSGCDNSVAENEVIIIENNLKPNTPSSEQQVLITQNQEPEEEETTITKPLVKTQWETINIQEKLTFDQNMDLEQIPTPNQETNSSMSETVHGDKISECIARSIDLIDAPDSELMELGDNWGDTANSPKSPISPTQMFLNMFPLLPRESMGTVGESSVITMSNQVTSRPPTSAYSTHSHRSFFIDSMLPEDNLTASGNKNQPSTSRATLDFSHSLQNTTEAQPNKTATANKTATSLVPLSIVTPRSAADINATLISPLKLSKTLSSAGTTTATKYSEDNNQRLSSQPQYHPLVQSQHSFKDLNIFTDSMDFTTFPPVPFSQFSEHDLFRESTRSRGLFDSSLSFNVDLNVPQAAPEQLHNLEIPDNFQNFQLPTSRENASRFDAFSVHKSNSNRAPLMHASRNVSKSFPSNSNATSAQSISGSRNRNEVSFAGENRSPEKTLTQITTTSKTSPAKASPSCNQNQVNVSKHLFRPQVNELNQNQVATGYSEFYSRQNNQETGTPSNSFSNRVQPYPLTNESRNDAVVAHEKVNNPTSTYLSLSTFTPTTKSVSNSQLSTTSSTSQKTSAEKKQVNSKKSKSARESSPNNSTLTPMSNKSRKDNLKETIPKKKPVSKGRNSSAVKQFSDLAVQSQPFTSRSSSGIPSEIFGSAPQSHFFGHHNLQNLDQNPAIAIMSDFSLPLDPTNNNVHYDHYNMDFNFSSSANAHHNLQQFQPQSQTNAVQQQQHQSHNHHQQQSPSRSRPTPFYLQDVNCDTYDFHGQNIFSANNTQQSFLPQHRNIPQQNQNQLQYNRNSSTTQKAPHPHQSQASVTTNIDSTQCYQVPPSNQQHCQQVNYLNSTSSIPHQQGQNQNGNANAHVPRQNTPIHSNVIQHRGPSEPSLNKNNYVPVPTNNLNQSSQQQQQLKSKPASSISTTSHNNQQNQSLQSPTSQSTQPRNTSIAARNVPTPVSHRPVNWMTDSNATPPASQHNVFRSNSKSSTTSATNPFSVSKLVGNSSNPLPNPLNRHTGSSTNYCAEALIRKNPPSSTSQVQGHVWSNSPQVVRTPQQSHTFFQPSGGSSHSHQSLPIQHQSNATFSPHHPSSSGAMNPNFNEDFNLSGYQLHSSSHSMNLSHSFATFDASQLQALNQQENSHNIHQQFPFQSHSQNQSHNNNNNNLGSGTSSVSNFNLSTIFPEINDKRQQPPQSQAVVGSSGISRSNSASGNTRNSSSNNCVYYPQQQQPPSHAK